MSDGEEQRFATAEELYEDMQNYIAAGFTREEAMQWLCRSVVIINQTPIQYPPEAYEFWERQNALATKMSMQMDDDE